MEELKTISKNSPQISLQTLLTWATKNGAEFFGWENEVAQLCKTQLGDGAALLCCKVLLMGRKDFDVFFLHVPFFAGNEKTYFLRLGGFQSGCDDKPCVAGWTCYIPGMYDEKSGMPAALIVCILPELIENSFRNSFWIVIFVPSFSRSRVERSPIHFHEFSICAPCPKRKFGRAYHVSIGGQTFWCRHNVSFFHVLNTSRVAAIIIIKNDSVKFKKACGLKPEWFQAAITLFVRKVYAQKHDLLNISGRAQPCVRPMSFMETGIVSRRALDRIIVL